MHHFQATSLSWQRRLLMAAAVLIPVAFLPAAIDPVDVPKITVTFAAAAGVLLLSGSRAAATGRFALARTPVVYAVLAFVLALGVSWLASPLGGRSLFGMYQRYTGALAYVAYAVLLLGVARSFDRSRIRPLLTTLVVGHAGVVVYGLSEWAGLRITSLVGDYADRVVSTIGNPSTLAGFLAIGVPLAVYLACSRRSPVWTRVIAGLGAVGALALMIPTRTAQGPMAIAAGLTVLLVAWLVDRTDRVRNRGLIGFAVVGVAGATAFVAGLMGSGPLALLSEEVIFEGRLAYLETALEMFRADPVTGVGIGLFGTFFFLYRPTSLALASANTFADSPHNVPLEMLATGGVLLGLAYLAVVATVAWLLVRGLWRAEGEDRLMLGAIGGSWVAYQAESLVGIDDPGIAPMQWLLAGAIVAVVGVDWTEVRIPGPDRPGGGRAWRRRRSIVLWSAALLALPLLWGATIPLRADLAGADTIRAYNAGRANEALAAAESAHTTAPWERQYVDNLVRVLSDGGRPEEALTELEETLERDRYWRDGHARAAELAAEQSREGRAWEHMQLAVEADPSSPDMRVRAARFARDLGRTDEARRLARAALDLAPGYDRAEELLEELDAS